MARYCYCKALVIGHLELHQDGQVRGRQRGQHRRSGCRQIAGGSLTRSSSDETCPGLAQGQMPLRLSWSVSQTGCWGSWRKCPESPQMVHENRKIGIENIVKETGLSMDTVHAVLRDHLSLDGHWEWWRQNEARAMISTALLIRYNADPELSHIWLWAMRCGFITITQNLSSNPLKRKHACSPRRNYSRSHAPPRNWWQL